MEVCCFFSRLNYIVELEISEEYENGQNGNYSWDYGSSCTDLRNFVVDCLNSDYFSIASGDFSVSPHSDDDLAAMVNERLEIRAAAYKKLGSTPFHLETETWWTHEEMPRLQKIYQIVKQDLSTLDIDYYRHVVDTIYSRDSFSQLSPIQKLYAFNHSLLKNRTRPKNEFSVIVSDEIESRLSQIGDKGPIFLDDISPDLETAKGYDEVCKILLGQQHKITTEISPFYKFCSLRDTFVFLFYEMVQSGLCIQKCPNCGRYFPTDRKNDIYCELPSPETPLKSCREYVKYQTYLKKSHGEATRLHKQIYNQKANKVRRTSNIKLKEDLEQFMRNSERWRELVRLGEKTEQEYIEWLQQVKTRKNEEGQTHTQA